MKTIPGLKIFELEADSKLQDLTLTTHHAFMHTFSNSGALKIIMEFPILNICH
jgi:hypothetical protein